MKRNIIHTLWTVALLLTACTQEDFALPGTGDALPLSITVTDGGFNGTSRAAEDGYRTEFSDCDACGLYIVRGGEVIYDNVKLTATAGTDGKLTWQPEADENLAGGLSGEKYFLYYPYQEVMSGKTDASATDADGFFAPLVSGCQPAADQSTYAAYTSSDLMTAQGNAAKDADGFLRLSFAMSHRMALAVIEMPKTVYKFTNNTDGSIPDYTVATSADFTGSNALPYRMADDTYRCIVNPAQPKSLIGTYDNGKKEFIITPNCINGSYKTYKVDGLTPIEKQTPLQMGDYFCKDSDNKWYIIPQEATPDANVIGIVFYVGQHGSDNADYTDTGIGQSKCHGYVVALTDVNNDRDDCLRWQYGPNNEHYQEIGSSDNNNDWKGYSNSLKFHEFINNNEDWEMKHFPAALACETYGNRTLDHDGNDAKGKYDWQMPLAAPQNTSGWFLPSAGQLKHLYANPHVLSARIDVVKNSTPDDCSYKNYIKWFETWYYWSSTEYSSFPDHAYYLLFYNGVSTFGQKDWTRDVRAVLAF